VAEKSLFRERFGLDYLSKKGAFDVSEHDEQTEMPSGMKDALIVYSRPILESLKNKPDNASRLFEIASELTVRIDTLLPVVKYLLTNGYVMTLQEDSLGNDLIRLTDAGKKLVT
jgi:hypothetical protein